MRFNKNILGLSVALGAISISQLAVAQSWPDAEISAEESGLGVILFTATKESEDAQDVPAAIAVL